MDGLRQYGEQDDPEVDEASPEVILESERIFQAKNEQESEKKVINKSTWSQP